jgi:ABC-2 type transport system permease protein
MDLKKNIKGIYAIWYREFKVFTRERVRVASSVFTPLMWYFIFGADMGGVTNVGTDYKHFIFPGFLVMIIIFSSLFNGAYIVWDKKIDFLKEVLIAPLSRTVIFFGKVLGCMTDALLQSFLLLVVGIFLGIPFTPVSVLLTIAMLFSLAIGLVSMGLIIGSFMESPEAFGIVSSVVVFPMFLLSGALYPLDNLPAWLKVLTRIDPASYAVDGLRDIILHISAMPYLPNLLTVLGFDAALVITGTWAFNRMKL